MAELLVDRNDGTETLGTFASDVVDAAGQFTGARR